MHCNGRAAGAKAERPADHPGAGDPGRTREALGQHLALPPGAGSVLSYYRARRKRHRALRRQLSRPAHGVCTSSRCSCCRWPSRSASLPREPERRAHGWSAEAHLAVRARARLGALDELQRLIAARNRSASSRRRAFSERSSSSSCLASAPNSTVAAIRVGVHLRQLLRRSSCWSVACSTSSRVQLARARARLRASGSSSVLVEELDHPRRVGQVVLALEQAEGPGATREDVHAAVLHALEHLLDRARAADRLQLLVGEPHDPELALAPRRHSSIIAR